MKERMFWIWAIFTIFTSVAFADLQIRTSLTDSTAYLKNLVLTNNGLTNGVEKINLDGANGNISLNGDLVAVGNVQAPEVCIAGICKTYWPWVQWTEDSSDIYRLSGKVGIWTNTPNFALDVSGLIHSSGGLTVTAGTVTLPTDSITSAFINDNSISSTDIKDGDITTTDIKDGTITKDDIATTTIVNSNISNTASIDGTKILSNFGSQNLIVNGNSFYVDYASGSVGIGTSLPASKLDVRWTVRAMELCDENGSNCVDMSSWLGVTAHSLESDGGTYSNVVYVDSAANVWVGHTLPSAKLDIKSDIDTSTDWYNNNKATLKLYNSTGDSVMKFENNTNRIVYGWNTSSDQFIFSSRETGATNGENIVFDNNGQVGIWVTPNYKLDVYGTARLYDMGAAGTPNLIVWDDAYITDVDHSNFLWVYGLQDSTKGGIALGWENSFIYGDGTNIGIGTTNPTSKLEVVWGSFAINNSSESVKTSFSSSVGDFLSIEAFNSDNTAKKSIILNAWWGNVGIGTTNPTATLEVNGNVKANNFIGTLNWLKMYAGFKIFGGGTCDNVNSPCSIDISGGLFGSAPICTLTMINWDGTWYTENMVIQSTTSTTLKIWKGENQNEGTTMKVNWICIWN